MRYRYWLWTTTVLIFSICSERSIFRIANVTRFVRLLLVKYFSRNLFSSLCFFLYISRLFLLLQFRLHRSRLAVRFFLFSNGHYYSLELARVIPFELPLWQATWHPGDFFSDNFAAWVFFISRERRVQDASKLLPRWTRFAHVNVFNRSLFISPTFSLPFPLSPFFPPFFPLSRRQHEDFLSR